MLSSIPEEPWATVCADFVGPLPRSRHGHNMLLVFTDKFSKWVELVPLRKATSASLQVAFRERIIARFGVPKQIITDNGAQFTARSFTKYLHEIGVAHRCTAPYSPQENPTERANRTIKTMIAQYVEENHKCWDELLPEISLAINTSNSESTGYSPAFLVQGREPRLPNAVFDQVTRGTGEIHEEPAERAKKLQEIFQIVKRNLATSASNQAKYYNLRHRDWRPKVGELVWLRQYAQSNAAENQEAKLAPKYDGPYKVVKFTSPVIVKLKESNGHRNRTAHVKDLKPFYGNPVGKSSTIRQMGGQNNCTSQTYKRSREDSNYHSW